MYVCGFASASSRPSSGRSSTDDASRWRPRPACPARSASRSSTIQPTLCRVSAYWLPGFPRPTTSFTIAGGPPDEHGERPRDRVRRGSRPWYRRSRISAGVAAPARASRPPRPARRGPSRRRGACRASRGGELVASAPADVAGLAAATLLGLLDGPLDRDDHVAEVLAACRAAGRTPRGRSSIAASGGRPGCGGNAAGGSSGNERTSVGPSLPMWVALRSASSASFDRIRPMDAGLGAPAASERGRDRPREPGPSTGAAAGRRRATPRRSATARGRYCSRRLR